MTKETYLTFLVWPPFWKGFQALDRDLSIDRAQGPIHLFPLKSLEGVFLLRSWQAPKSENGLVLSIGKTIYEDTTFHSIAVPSRYK